MPALSNNAVEFLWTTLDPPSLTTWRQFLQLDSLETLFPDSVMQYVSCTFSKLMLFNF